MSDQRFPVFPVFVAPYKLCPPPTDADDTGRYIVSLSTICRECDAVINAAAAAAVECDGQSDGQTAAGTETFSRGACRSAVDRWSLGDATRPGRRRSGPRVHRLSTWTHRRRRR